MKIILTQIGDQGKVFLDDGTDITKDLRIHDIKVYAKCGDIVKAILTVYPSEVIVELEDGNIEFRKHPDWDTIKDQLVK